MPRYWVGQCAKSFPCVIHSQRPNIIIYLVHITTIEPHCHCYSPVCSNLPIQYVCPCFWPLLPKLTSSVSYAKYYLTRNSLKKYVGQSRDNRPNECNQDLNDPVLNKSETRTVFCNKLAAHYKTHLTGVKHPTRSCAGT